MENLAASMFDFKQKQCRAKAEKLRWGEKGVAK